MENLLSDVYFEKFLDVKGRILVVTSKGRSKTKYFKKFFSKRKDIDLIFIEGEPNIEDIDISYKDLKDKNFSCCFAFGGGSAIDFAKILIFSLNIKKEPSNVLKFDFNRHKRKTPLYIFPTTYGSGSEMTSIAVFKKFGIKSSLKSKSLFPDRVFIFEDNYPDPEEEKSKYFISDAFCHALESFYSKNSNCFSREISKLSMKIISKNILSKNKKSKTDFALASLLAGLAEDFAGVGIIHALAYPLQNKLGFSHSYSNFLTLSKVKGKFFGDNNFSLLKDCDVPNVIKKMTNKVKMNDDIDLEEMTENCLVYEKLIKNSPVLITKKFIKSFYSKL